MTRAALRMSLPPPSMPPWSWRVGGIGRSAACVGSGQSWRQVDAANSRSLTGAISVKERGVAGGEVDRSRKVVLTASASMATLAAGSLSASTTSLHQRQRQG
jgi:hypothetical protein